MTNREKTNIEISMNNSLKNLDPESFRYKVLETAKKFKSNWLDLGQNLSDLLKNQDFQKWGYRNFEDYCKRELKIKLDTAMKLVSSFGYLKKHEPKLISSGLESVPDFKVINKLADIEKIPDFGKEKFKELHEQVFNEGISEGKLQKQIMSMSSNESIESPKDDNDEKLLEKLKKSINILKNLLPVFEADDSVFSSLNKIEKFINEIEI